MLFPTAAFSFAFLPIVLLAFFLIARRFEYGAATWLFLASVFFYGYWMPAFTLLLLASIVVNFYVGGVISRRVGSGSARDRALAKVALIFGITLNLATLVYFKYANFFIDNLNTGFGLHVDIGRVILPVGISFYTFTQIAFLADTFSKGIKEYKFAHYGLFVTYFPHLIAGPVLHHGQMMPQFAAASTYRPKLANLAAGLAIFALGLAKKIVLADGVAPYADAIFNATDTGIHPTFVEAWIGTLAYTFQIYFDFSGYSDMAIGLGLLFNIRLPLNFNSPYKSLNIVEFWRRWHMSLSTFLRDYLYIPLGGGRHGPVRRHVNLMLTMLLGGLWHGASWTFVFWGALHGGYLIVNHTFAATMARRAVVLERAKAWRLLSMAMTFLCVVVAWVFFRAHSFSGAALMLQSLSPYGAGTEVDGVHAMLWNSGLDLARAWWWCAALALIAFVAPNSNAIGDAVLRRCLVPGGLRCFVLGASAAAMILLIVLNEARDSVSAFIYFNF